MEGSKPYACNSGSEFGSSAAVLSRERERIENLI